MKLPATGSAVHYSVPYCKRKWQYWRFKIGNLKPVFIPLTFPKENRFQYCVAAVQPADGRAQTPAFANMNGLIWKTMQINCELTVFDHPQLYVLFPVTTWWACMVIPLLLWVAILNCSYNRTYLSLDVHQSIRLPQHMEHNIHYCHQ